MADFTIQLNEPDAAERRVEVVLEKLDGTPQTSLSGVTAQYKKAGGSDATIALTADGTLGRYYMQLGAGDVDTIGQCWVTVTGASIIPVTLAGMIQDFETHVLARIPAALSGTSFMKATVMDLDTAAVTAIAAAVWDALCADHTTAGSLAECVQMALGLLHGRAMIDQFTYGGSNVVTSVRVRIWRLDAGLAAAVAGHANGADGENWRFRQAAVDAGSGQISSYKISKEL